jgi:hypothetical protein
MRPECPHPLSLGPSELVREWHDLSKAQRVRAPNSDNAKLRQLLLGWEHQIPLMEGLVPTLSAKSR